MSRGKPMRTQKNLKMLNLVDETTLNRTLLRNLMEENNSCS